MWIFKYSKELLEHLKSKAISKVSSIKTFDFPMRYTTIPHEQLKSRWPNKKLFDLQKWFTIKQVCSRKVQHCIFR